MVGSEPGNAMPAALRTRLRPPSHPTRYAARSVLPSSSETSTPVSSCDEPGHLAPAMDGHGQFADPVGQYALDVVLPQTETIRVSRGKVADIQPGARKPGHLGHLPRGEKPICDPALIEHLDGAGVQPARPPALEILARAPLDDRDVDARQCQFAREHEPGRDLRPRSERSYPPRPNLSRRLLLLRRAKIRAMLRRAILEVRWPRPISLLAGQSRGQGSRFSRARPLAKSSGAET